MHFFREIPLEFTTEIGVTNRRFGRLEFAAKSSISTPMSSRKRVFLEVDADVLDASQIWETSPYLKDHLA